MPYCINPHSVDGFLQGLCARLPIHTNNYPCRQEGKYDFSMNPHLAAAILANVAQEMNRPSELNNHGCKLAYLCKLETPIACANFVMPKG